MFIEHITGVYTVYIIHHTLNIQTPKSRTSPSSDSNSKNAFYVIIKSTHLHKMMNFNRPLDSLYM